MLNPPFQNHLLLANLRCIIHEKTTPMPFRRFLYSAVILFYSFIAFSQTTPDLHVSILQPEQSGSDGRVLVWGQYNGTTPETVVFALYDGTIPDVNHGTNLITTRTFTDVQAGEEVSFEYLLPIGDYTATMSYSIVNATFHFEMFRVGCTDPGANNYDPIARYDDGSCVYDAEVCPSNIFVTAVEPDCGESNGSIFVSSHGTSLLYSFDGGSTFTSSPLYADLSEGTYDIVVKNVVLNCTDALTYDLVCDTGIGNGGGCAEIYDIEVIEHPTSCSSNNGSFIVSAFGDNNEYSADGGQTWQVYSGFQGMSAGTYTIVVRHASGVCSDQGDCHLRMCSNM